MKSKRNMSLMLVMAMLLSLLAGCGAEKKETQVLPEQTKAVSETLTGGSEKKTVLKWAIWSADTQPYWEAITQEYMNQNPDVSIELVDLGATDYSTALATQLAGGKAPFDVVSIKNSGSYVSLISKGILQPLDIEKIDRDLYGETLDALEWKDELYTLPLRSDFYVIFYNKGVFDKANVEYPTNDITFEEYDAMTRKLADPAFGSETFGSHYHIWSYCVQGMAAAGEEKNVMHGPYDYMKPYYEMVLNQQNDKVCMDYSTLKTSGLHYTGAFGQGNIGTMVMGTWAIGTILNRINEGQYPDLTNWGIVSYPHAKGKEAGDTIGNFVGVSVVKASANAEIAQDFARFAGGAEGAKIVASKGYMPGAMSEDALNVIFSTKGFPQDQQSKDAILDVGKIYLDMPIEENCTEIDQILSTGHDYIMTGTMTIEDGITYMNEETEKLKK